MGRRTCERMVAPSFVTVISPSGEIKILSNPLGPCKEGQRVSNSSCITTQWCFFVEDNDILAMS